MSRSVICVACGTGVPVLENGCPTCGCRIYTNSCMVNAVPTNGITGKFLTVPALERVKTLMEQSKTVVPD